MAFKIKVNGVDHTVDVDDDTPLLWVLRDVLGMTCTKFGCSRALCGACTIHIDGAATRSCITPVDSIGASEIMAIEAISTTSAGAKERSAANGTIRSATLRAAPAAVGLTGYAPAGAQLCIARALDMSRLGLRAEPA
jgi:aerobic-type carbon monoxide dehydrogenase small subunit (CoxS/CutS family)